MERETIELLNGVLNNYLKIVYQMLDRAALYSCHLDNGETYFALKTLRDEVRHAKESVEVKCDVRRCLATRCDKCSLNDVGGRVCKRYAEKADAIMELVKQAESK